MNNLFGHGFVKEWLFLSIFSLLMAGVACTISQPAPTDDAATICAGRCGMVEGIQCGPCGYGYACDKKGYCIEIEENDSDDRPSDSDLPVQDDDIAAPDEQPKNDADVVSDAPSSCGTEPFRAKAVSAGERHACAIATDGSLWCWGDNYAGKLGIGNEIDKRCPTLVGNDTSWQIVSAGSGQTCGIKKDNTLWCWGLNYSGKLGIGVEETDPNNQETFRYTSSQKVGENWISVSSGRIVPYPFCFGQGL